MKTTLHKIETLRVAKASAQLTGDKNTLTRLMKGNTPKGNAIDVARTAGLLAAKRTDELIPHCHPLPLDEIQIEFSHQDSVITIQSTVTAIAKTGVEMEALVAVSVAALTLYDVGKAMDTNLIISDTRLIEKKGGKTSFVEKIPANFRAAIVVTSDSTAAGTRQDAAGKIIQERLGTAGVKSAAPVILPDDAGLIEKLFLEFCQSGVDLVLSTGGTGLGPRDVTVEATQRVIERELPGIAEALRVFGQKRTPYAMLSRGLAGVCGKTIIVNLPGSSRGVSESLDAIFPAILHAYHMMRGEGH